MRARPGWVLFLAAVALGLVALLSASAPSAAYSTPGGSGNVTLDSIGAPPSAVWKVSASPLVYQVNETLVVSAGDVLQVPGGAEIQFVNNTELVVLGGLDVQGTATQPVTMRVVPDPGGMAVSWQGLRGDGAAVFVLDHADLRDTIDVALTNLTGAFVRDVAYEGRLFIDNSSLVLVERVTMKPTPTDVGRISLWVENSANVSVAGADLEGGTGWGGSAVLIENSADVRLEDVVVRDDNQNLVGLELILSRRVRVQNFTFTQGPSGGDPNQALDVLDSDDVWIENLLMTHVGQSGLGAIYGIRSNVTIANSTFPEGLSQGVWQFQGRLTSVNTTALPVRPEFGAEIWEFELAMINAQWSAGGSVTLGAALVENASWNASATVAGGSTPWLGLLREVNASGAVNTSSAYTASVTCNCTGASSSFNLTDAWGVIITVLVGDASPPVAVAQIAVARTGEEGTLEGTASFDNAQVAAYRWALLGGATAAGLPCASAVCRVTFYEPGNFTVELTVTDTSGNNATRRAVARIVDATPPQVSIVSVDPARPGEDEPFAVMASAIDNDPAFLPVIEWYIDGARVLGDTLSPTFRVPSIGDHNVRVVIRDDAGNSGEANRTVTVRDSTAPVIALWTPPAGLEAPATVELNGSAATDNVGVVSWVWHVVGAGTEYNLTGARRNATFPSGGAYNVTLTVLDAEGNAASRTFVVDVQAPPSPDGISSAFLPVIVGVSVVGAVAVAWLVGRRRSP